MPSKINPSSVASTTPAMIKINAAPKKKAAKKTPKRNSAQLRREFNASKFKWYTDEGFKYTNDLTKVPYPQLAVIQSHPQWRYTSACAHCTRDTYYPDSICRSCEFCGKLAHKANNGCGWKNRKMWEDNLPEAVDDLYFSEEEFNVVDKSSIIWTCDACTYNKRDKVRVYKTVAGQELSVVTSEHGVSLTEPFPCILCKHSSVDNIILPHGGFSRVECKKCYGEYLKL